MPASEVRFLTALRVNGYWTAEKLAFYNLIADRYLHECPFCGEGVPEDRMHLMVDCDHFAALRRLYLQPLWDLVGATTREEKLEAALGGGLTLKLSNAKSLQDCWVIPCLRYVQASRRVRMSTLDGLFVGPPRSRSPPAGMTSPLVSVPN